MSLESQIAALVSAANSLTSQVAGKMAQIDQKVNQATASVPGTIRDLSGKRYHIDNEVGDDSNDGSAGSPLRSAEEAAKRAIPGAYVELYFKGGQDHIVRFRQRCGVRVVGWENDTRGKPRLHPAGYDFSNDTTQKILQGFVDVGPYIVFSGVDLHCDDAGYNPNGSQSVNTFYSAMVFGDASIKIFMNNVDIRLDHVSLTSNWAGYSQRDLSMNNTSIQRAGASGARLLRDRSGSTSTLRLACNSVTLLNGITWPDLIPIYNNGSNVLSNIAIQ